MTFNDSTDVIGDVEAVAKATAAVIKRECTTVQAMSFLRIVMRDLKEASIAGESESGDPLHFSDTDIAKIASTEDLTMINKRVSEIMTKGGIDLRCLLGSSICRSWSWLAGSSSSVTARRLKRSRPLPWGK